MQVGDRFRNRGLVGENFGSISQQRNGLEAISFERCQRLGQRLIDALQQQEGRRSLVFKPADASAGVTRGSRAEGPGQPGRVLQAGHGAFGGGNGLSGQFTQLTGDDVEGSAARAQLGTFDRCVDTDEAHIGLDFAHSLHLGQQGVDRLQNSASDLLDLAALGLAIEQHDGGVAHRATQCRERRLSAAAALPIDAAAVAHNRACIRGQVIQGVTGFRNVGFEGLCGAGQLAGLKPAYRPICPIHIVVRERIAVEQITQGMDTRFDVFNALAGRVTHLQGHDRVADPTDNLA